jgi:steroid delta-isomerase-like uncharacterized protein
VSESSRDPVARFYAEVINDHRLDALDELVADEFVEHGTRPLVGRDAFRGFLVALATGLPDVSLEVEDWITEGDRVVARCHVTGTQTGELFGYAPTGRRIGWGAIHIWRIADGRLAERWAQADMVGIIDQLEGR